MTNWSYGMIVVERLHDPVAIQIRVGIRVVAAAHRIEAARIVLRVARDVEPVPAPGLAVPRRRQQTIDDLRECVRRRVVDEGVDLLGASAAVPSGRAWRAGSASAGPRARTGASPSRSSRARTNRSMSVFAHSAFVRPVRRRRLRERLERPPRRAARAVIAGAAPRQVFGAARVAARRRPRRALRDPLAERPRSSRRRASACPSASAGSRPRAGSRGSGGSSSGSPGTMAGPVSPPLSIASRESSRSPPSRSSTWHSPHVSISTGRMLASKNSICWAVGAGAIACAGAAATPSCGWRPPRRADARRERDPRARGSMQVSHDGRLGDRLLCRSAVQIPMRILTLFAVIACATCSAVLMSAQQTPCAAARKGRNAPASLRRASASRLRS